MSMYQNCSVCNRLPCICDSDDTERDYPCHECGEGVLVLRRSGNFVTGECSNCKHKVDFELPEESEDF